MLIGKAARPSQHLTSVLVGSCAAPHVPKPQPGHLLSWVQMGLINISDPKTTMGDLVKVICVVGFPDGHPKQTERLEPSGGQLSGTAKLTFGTITRGCALPARHAWSWGAGRDTTNKNAAESFSLFWRGGSTIVTSQTCQKKKNATSHT